MLKLHSLIIEDFGPYKGEQRVEFPDRPGVVVIYGENRRGKTSLLNAIRFALLGTVVTRGSRPLEFYKILNTEARANGKASFRVSLAFSFDGDTYFLTRRCEPGAAVSWSSAATSIVASVFLERNGIALTQDETEEALVQVMPPAIARFFLFDGELLSEYEELLRDQGENIIGRKIADSIEQILGMPALQNADVDLNALAEDASREETRAAQKNQATQHLGTVLEQLSAQLQTLRREQADFSERLDNAIAKRTELADVLSKSRVLKSLIEERQTDETTLRALEVKLAEKTMRLQEVMTGAWRVVLSSALRPLEGDLDLERKRLRDAIGAQLLAAARADELRKAVALGRCPVCAQAVPEVDLRAFADAAATSGESEMGDAPTRLARIEEDLDLVRKLRAAGSGAHALDLFNDIEEINVSIASKRARVRELLEEIAEHDEKEFREQQKAYDQTIGEIDILQRGVDASSSRILEIEAKKDDAQRRLDRTGGADLTAERRKRQLFASLSKLFRTAIEVYRDRLKKTVEKDATDLFLRLTSEPDDKGLRINDQYGLTIEHKDGTDIVVRSSGAEQIVALSLMGALQQNSPLRGPLIADSLLIRIDDTHRENLIQALPRMAEQIVLLVFRAELNSMQARERLGTHLLREYQLTRISAKHTIIEPYQGY